jgi:SPP1 family predicted phage head-tail adaptor
MALRAGTLDKRVVLQSVSRAPDGGGGSVDTWSDVATLWAAVRPLTGQERFLAQQVQAKLDTEIEIRHRAGVVAQQRFEYDARHFYIVQPPINPDSRNERLVCLCEERNT